MQEHTVKAFDEDITRLRGLIAEMGGLSEARNRTVAGSAHQGR